MKKFGLFLLFMAVSVAGFSQVTWNAKAGLNFSNWSSGDADTKVGFKIGGGMEYAFNDIWAIQPSLFVSSKGIKASVSEGNTSAKATCNQVYLEIPVMGAARIQVANTTNLVFSAGPYMAYGIGGKTSLKINGAFNSNEKVNTFSELDRFDCGFGLGFAAEFDRLVVGLDGQFGVVEITDGGPKNQNFSLSVGYKF